MTRKVTLFIHSPEHQYLFLSRSLSGYVTVCPQLAPLSCTTYDAVTQSLRAAPQGNEVTQMLTEREDDRVLPWPLGSVVGICTVTAPYSMAF